MENYKPQSVIKLPEPTDNQLEGWCVNHPKEHAIASWQLWQIELLLNDLAMQAPSGYKMNLHFKAISEGENRMVTRTEANYDRWLFKTS